MNFPVDDDVEQQKRFEIAWQKAIEFFPDALLIVRLPSGIVWRFSDINWAHGAADRMRALSLATDIQKRNNSNAD